MFAAIFLWLRKGATPGQVTARATGASLGLILQGLAFSMVWMVRRSQDSSIWPGALWVDVAVAAVVLVLMVISVVLSLLAVRELGRQWAVQARTVEQHELITTGPFALLKHPLYVGFCGLFLATGLALTDWRALGFACLAFGGGMVIRIRAEDELLAATFGSAFEDYRRRVPAVIPSIRAVLHGQNACLRTNYSKPHSPQKRKAG